MTQLVIVILILLFGGVAQGEEKIAGSISSGVDSTYLVKPGFIVHDGPIWWNNIRLEYDGWYANIWGLLALQSERETFGDEVDFKLGKKFSVAECNIDLSGSYFVLSKFGDFTDDLWVFDGRADFPNRVPFVTPWVAIRYFGGVGEKSPRSGWFGWIGLQRVQPFGFTLPTQEEEFALELNGWMAFSAGRAFGGEAGPVYTRLEVSTDFHLTEHIFVTPRALWQAPLQDRRPYVEKGKHDVDYGLSVTYRF